MSLSHMSPRQSLSRHPQTLKNQEPKGLTTEPGGADPTPMPGGGHTVWPQHLLLGGCTLGGRGNQSPSPPQAKGMHMTSAQPIGFSHGTFDTGQEGHSWSQSGPAGTSLPSHPCMGPAPQGQANELCLHRGCFRSSHPAPRVFCCLVRFCHSQPQSPDCYHGMQAKPQEPRTMETIPNYMMFKCR